jgi:biotin carboxyl carrier protein
MERAVTVTSIAPGVYRVSDGERQWTVAVAGSADNWWVWIDGRVLQVRNESVPGRERRRASQHDLSSPMPATVVRVLVQPGAEVKRGDTLVVLEAMKMELPIRAPLDAIIKAVHCREGELVQPGVSLVDLE